MGGLGTVAQSNVGASSTCREARAPLDLFLREFVDAGGLMAYGVSYPDLYRRARIR